MDNDNILNNNNFDDYIDQLAELVMAKIVEKYGKVYPLRFSDNQEEILIGELARLTTTLALLEDRYTQPDDEQPVLI